MEEVTGRRKTGQRHRRGVAREELCPAEHGDEEAQGEAEDAQKQRLQPGIGLLDARHVTAAGDCEESTEADMGAGHNGEGETLESRHARLARAESRGDAKAFGGRGEQ